MDVIQLREGRRVDEMHKWHDWDDWAWNTEAELNVTINSKGIPNIPSPEYLLIIPPSINNYIDRMWMWMFNRDSHTHSHTTIHGCIRRIIIKTHTESINSVFVYIIKFNFGMMIILCDRDAFRCAVSHTCATCTGRMVGNCAST